MSKKKNSRKSTAPEKTESDVKTSAEAAEQTEEATLLLENEPAETTETKEAVVSDEPTEIAEEISEIAEISDNDDADEAEETDEASDEEDEDADSEQRSDKEANVKLEKGKSEKKLSPEKAQKKAERKDRRSLKARAFRRGWFSIALVALFIAGVIVINLIASTLVQKVPALVADTTGSGSFDLTDDTLDYLKKLQQDIKIIVLADEKTYREGGEYYIQSDSLLHKYDDNSSRVSLEFMDLASNPTFTSKYPDEELAQYGIIVEGANDYKYLSTMDYFDVQVDYTSYSYYIAGCKVEEAVTSAILNVTLENKPKVSFISGITDEDYSAFMTYLENNGFETEELSPAIDNISEDTEILVLYAPNVDLDAAYVDKISAFLNNGGEYGKQLLYLPGSSLKSMPNIDSLLEEWGLAVDNGYAVENDMSKISQITYDVFLFATDYEDTTYTEKMKNSSLPFCVFYGNGVYTHPVNILDADKASTLLKLSDSAQVIYPPETGDEPITKDMPGLCVGALATKSSTKTDTESGDSDTEDTVTNSSNIVVIGSNYAVTESFLGSNLYGNASYMLSLLNTLAGRDNVGIEIETQSLDAETLTISAAQLAVLTIAFAVVLPLAVLIAGIVVFIKRRNM